MNESLDNCSSEMTMIRIPDPGEQRSSLEPIDITFFSTADWDNPFWTNKQHVARELVRRGNRVFYIESIGLRRPSVSGADFRRILKRLRRGFSSPRLVEENLWVWSPFAIPLQGWRLVQWLNRCLVELGIWIWQKRLRFARQLVWTYNPMTLRVMSPEGYAGLVYHCVDEVKAQPGMPSKEIENAEKELVLAADVCFTTAEYLYQTRRVLNANTHYFGNVADYVHFKKALKATTVVPDDIEDLPRPRIGFIGAISSYKVDFELLRTMARRHPEWSIVLVGKIGEGEPGTKDDALKEHGNIHLLGPRNYEALPAILKGFDVAILPSVLNEYTRGMFPMKFYEYLAAGVPIVATNLDALQNLRDVAWIAADEEDFIRGVEAAVRGDAAPLEKRIAAAREQTYEARTKRMMEIVQTSIGKAGGQNGG